MTTNFVLNAQLRADVGKGASRRLRKHAGEIPAIIYGEGKAPVSITLAHKDILHAVQNETFFSHLITLDLGKTKENVIIKDLQRHPARPLILHADFLRVSADHEITVKVPLHFLNQESCVGVKLGGGQIHHLITELEISCLPKDLPEYIEVDMQELKVGDNLHISNLALPKGVSSIDLNHGNDLGVVTVSARKGAADDDAESADTPDADA
ncbi:MAG: 50S ribosomal protein L25/general stress protein Ctc [Pseudomonadales bacterium]|nr:50S ribosomal protein L25/general stress protein Ctc [Pseudomonadales bacterium]